MPDTKKNLDGLTPKMLVALKHAWTKQTAGQSFSLKELDGSKSGLINRDMLEIVTIYRDKKPVHTWRLTKKGKSVIKDMENGSIY